MALVIYGNGVAGMSGKIAGNVAARNRSGAYMRQWTKPVNPGSIKQTEARTRFASQSAGWGDLDSGQRDAWNFLAQGTVRQNRLGQDYIPTGRQLFMELNSNMALIGEPVFTDAPSDLNAPKNDLDYSITATGTTGTLTGLVGVNFDVDANTFTVIEATAPMPNTRVNVNNRFRFLFAANATATPALLAPYIAAFTDVAADGLLIHFRTSKVNAQNGCRSPYATFDSVVV